MCGPLPAGAWASSNHLPLAAGRRCNRRMREHRRVARSCCSKTTTASARLSSRAGRCAQAARAGGERFGSGGVGTGQVPAAAPSLRCLPPRPARGRPAMHLQLSYFSKATHFSCLRHSTRSLCSLPPTGLRCSCSCPYSDTPPLPLAPLPAPQYPVTVLNLPSVVESYKTLDDVNLVKTTDIGQVRSTGRNSLFLQS